MDSRTNDCVKRGIDFVAGSIALICTLPLQCVIALLVRGKLGSPILFRQQRPGKDEKLFELIKFRTLRTPDPAAGLISDADRMTQFGSLLRSTSLDELPTLWNVVKGDMSLVGPRPLLVQYLDRYSPEQRRRHDVRPGLTGLTQVSGRNALTWSEKFNLDLQYVRERSLSLDLKILLATASKVLSRHGIASEGSVTMPEFLGDDPPRNGGTA